jgi:hypothetical protein
MQGLLKTRLRFLYSWVHTECHSLDISSRTLGIGLQQQLSFEAVDLGFVITASITGSATWPS